MDVIQLQAMGDELEKIAVSQEWVLKHLKTPMKKIVSGFEKGEIKNLGKEHAHRAGRMMGRMESWAKKRGFDGKGLEEKADKIFGKKLRSRTEAAAKKLQDPAKVKGMLRKGTTPEAFEKEVEKGVANYRGKNPYRGKSTRAAMKDAKSNRSIGKRFKKFIGTTKGKVITGTGVAAAGGGAYLAAREQ